MLEVQVVQMRSNGIVETKKDVVAIESPLHIFLNQTHYVTILCSPRQRKELAVGHLISEGVVNSITDVQRIDFKEPDRCAIELEPSINLDTRISFSQPFSRLIVSSCGSSDYWPLSKLMDRLALERVSRDFTVDVSTILSAMKQLNHQATTYQKTGGVHVAALFSPEGEMLAFSEDIGRHNAVDKIIGDGSLKQIDFKKTFMVLSGRLTGDIVLKTARLKIPILASLAAAIDSGIQIAELTQITLIGFVRGNRMNVYTSPERITS